MLCCGDGYGIDWYVHCCQVDRLLEALEIWKIESDDLHEYQEQCELVGKEVSE